MKNSQVCSVKVSHDVISIHSLQIIMWCLAVQVCLTFLVFSMRLCLFCIEDNQDTSPRSVSNLRSHNHPIIHDIVSVVMYNTLHSRITAIESQRHQRHQDNTIIIQFQFFPLRVMCDASSGRAGNDRSQAAHRAGT